MANNKKLKKRSVMCAAAAAVVVLFFATKDRGGDVVAVEVARPSIDSITEISSACGKIRPVRM